MQENKGRFKIGHIRSKESIEKQRQTMIQQIQLGLRKVPVPNWTPELRIKLSNSMRGKNHPRSKPLFSKRIHNTGGVKYYQIKTAYSGRWIYEHRFVMENYLGRKLYPYEHVHHKDKNTFNNQINNLELLSPSEHARHHGKSHPRNPKFTSKLPPDVWSRKFVSCINCQSTKFKHLAKGYCQSCYNKKYRKNIF